MQVEGIIVDDGVLRGKGRRKTNSMNFIILYLKGPLALKGIGQPSLLRAMVEGVGSDPYPEERREFPRYENFRWRGYKGC